MDDYGDCVDTVAELRQQLTTERKRAERAEAALAAVPVVAIDCIYDDARLENETPEVQAIWMQIGDWLASLESA